MFHTILTAILAIVAGFMLAFVADSGFGTFLAVALIGTAFALMVRNAMRGRGQ